MGFIAFIQKKLKRSPWTQNISFTVFVKES